MKIFLFFLLILPGMVAAHGNDFDNSKDFDSNENHDSTREQESLWYSQDPGSLSGHTLITAGLATTYRTGGLAENNLWQIPGLLMGGDAHSPQKGFALDEINLSLEWTNAEQIMAGFEFGKHGDHNSQFEQAYAGARIPVSDGITGSLLVGRLKARFSPENGSHAHARTFSENNLIYDAFFGGHYVDEGARFELKTGSLFLGTELWRGGQFPATSGSGGEAQDVYLYWQPGANNWRGTLGGWIFHARADDRTDSRLNDDHQHTNTTSNSANNVQFDGSHLITGLHASLLWRPTSSWQMGATVEIQRVVVDGYLSDLTRIAELEGRYTGYWIKPEISYGNHQFGFRYARLNLDNHLTGAGAPVLISESGLADMERDPDWMGVSYRFQWHQDLSIRLEWTRNQSIEAGANYAGIGLLWGATLLN
jgi:hypothetical protein